MTTSSIKKFIRDVNLSHFYDWWQVCIYNHVRVRIERIRPKNAIIHSSFKGEVRLELFFNSNICCLDDDFFTSLTHLLFICRQSTFREFVKRRAFFAFSRSTMIHWNASIFHLRRWFYGKDISRYMSWRTNRHFFKLGEKLNAHDWEKNFRMQFVMNSNRFVFLSIGWRSVSDMCPDYFSTEKVVNDSQNWVRSPS